MLPPEELEQYATVYAPLPEDAYRRMVLCPEVATLLISSMLEVTRWDASQAMIASSDYGYSRFTMDDGSASAEAASIVIARNHRKYQSLKVRVSFRGHIVRSKVTVEETACNKSVSPASKVSHRTCATHVCGA